MARRRRIRQAVTRVAAAPRAVARRVRSAGSRVVQVIRNTRSQSGLDLWSAAQQTLFAWAGGASSAIVDTVTVATETDFDDSPYTRLALKSAGALAIGALTGKSRFVNAFTSGMIGHSAGVALDSAALAKVKSLLGVKKAVTGK